MPDDHTPPPHYTAAALQLFVHPIHADMSVDAARARIGDNIADADRRIGEARAWIGDELKLVVLPEFYFTGFPRYQDADLWREQACFEPDGAEYTAIADIAARRGVFIAGNSYEVDDAFPGLYFQTSFVMSPAGEIVLRYRRLNSLWAASPHDVWDRYLDRYGLEGVFPVADTSIGRLGAVASEEVLFPEVARCLALRGAEVYIHSTAEHSSPIGSPKETCKVARAIENVAFLVSSNAAGFRETEAGAENFQGHSMVVDPRGVILAQAGVGDTMMCYAPIDLATVRRSRSRTGMDNLLARQRLEAYADSYRTLGTLRKNGLEGWSGDTPLRDRLRDRQIDAIERFKERLKDAPR